MKSKAMNALLLPMHMRPLYMVSVLPKPVVFQDANGNLQKGHCVITVKHSDDYFVVAQRTRIFTGPKFRKSDYDTLVRLLIEMYISMGADIGQMDTWVPGIEYSTFPWFFETEGEAEYYIDIFQKQKLDLVRSAKELTQVAWAQFYREYYSVL